MSKPGRFRPGPVALVALIALVVLAALYFAVRKPPYEVDVAAVTRGPMTVTIDDEGETRVHDLYVVAAPINGRLQRIELEAGDPVVAGQTVVARMVPVDPDFLDRRSEASLTAQADALDDMLASTTSRIAQARAARRLAAQERVRVKAVFDRGFATRAALDRANSTLAQTDAALAEAIRASEAARHDRDAARARLISPLSMGRPGKTLDIGAPVNGRVMRLPRESEAVIPVGTPLVEIGDPGKLEIVTDLLSADAVRIGPDARVKIENWGDPRPLNGRVRRIEPFGFTKISALGVEEQRVNVIIDIVDPPQRWTRLGHGYRVIVRVSEWESGDALQVPASALFRDKGAWAVFVVKDGKAKLVPVRIGRMNDVSAQVLNGLAKGDTVILHPSEKITSGARVETR